MNKIPNVHILEHYSTIAHTDTLGVMSIENIALHERN